MDVESSTDIWKKRSAKDKEKERSRYKEKNEHRWDAEIYAQRTKKGAAKKTMKREREITWMDGLHRNLTGNNFI